MIHTTILKYLNNCTTALGGIFHVCPRPASLLFVCGMIFILVACSDDSTDTTTPPTSTPSGNSWSHPTGLDDSISISSDSGVRQESNDPQVAMDNNGNAIIVWAQHTLASPSPPVRPEGRHEIFKSEYRSGSWVHPADITSASYISPDTAAGGHVYPQLAMNDSGQAVIAWRGGIDGSNVQTYQSNYNMSTTGAWKNPADSDDAFSEAMADGEWRNAQAAMGNNGDAVIVWEQLDDTADCSGGACTRIYMRDYRNSSWNVAGIVSPSGQHAKDPQVSMNDSGQAVIVWRGQDSPGGDYEIYRNDYSMTLSGDWSGAVNILAATAGSDAVDPQVAMDNDGNTIIVWAQHNDDPAVNRHEIFKSEYRFNSGTSLWEWRDPANSTENISPDGTGAGNPQVAMDDNGNAIIVWAQFNPAANDRDEIFKSEYRNESWDHPDNLNDNISIGGGHASLPQVAMDNNGNAIIVWEQYSGSTGTCLMEGRGTCKQIFKSEYRNGSWAHPADLTSASYISPDGGDASKPQVAMDDNGNAIIVWQQFDNTGACPELPGGTCTQIFMSEYPANRSGPADTTPPSLASTSPAAGATSISIALTSITATFDEDLSAGSISVSDGVAGTSSVSGNTITFTITSGDLATGTTYTVTVTGATDLAGNTAANSSWDFATEAADITPPDSPSVLGPGSPTSDNMPTWTWTSGGGDGNGTYRYELNDSDLTTGATETTATSYTPGSALSDGTHTLYVQERDDAGNWSASDSFAVTVDTTPPSVDSTIPLADAPSVSINTTVTACFNEPVVIGDFTLVDNLDNSVNGDVTDSGSNCYTFTPSSAVLTADTLYNAMVSATDLAGIPMPSAYGWSFTTGSGTDTSPPSVPGTPTDAGAYSTSTTVTFNWTAALDPESGIASYDLQVGTSPGGSDVFDSSVGNVLTYDVTDSNGQTLYARVQAVNGVGLVSSWSSNSDGITIDTTPPSNPSVLGPGSPTNNNTPTWTWTPGDGGNGTYRYELDDSDLSADATETTDTSYTPGSILLDGTHTLYVQERDDAGNWSASSSFGVIVDTTLPLRVSTSPAVGEQDVSIALTSITATFDEDLSAGSISVNGGVTGTSLFSGNTITFTITSGDLASGTTYTVTVTGATDIAGNTAANSSWNFDTEAAPASPFDPPIAPQESDASYDNNTSGLITGGTLASWLADWPTIKQSIGIAGKLIIFNVCVPAGCGNRAATPPWIQDNAAAGYRSFYVTTTAMVETRNTGAFSTPNMVLDGPSADSFFTGWDIDNGDMVVIVMAGGSNQNALMIQGRYWYMLRYWGYPADHLAILNGYTTAGVNNALSPYLGTGAGIVNTQPGGGTVDIKTLPDNTGLQASSGEMLAVARGDYAPPSGNIFLWDTREPRATDEFLGNDNATNGPNGCCVSFEGSIFEAVRIGWTDVGLIDTTGQYRPKSTLQSTLTAAGLVAGDTVYTWCRTSYRAMIGMVVSGIILGNPVKVYDPAWIEWGYLTDQRAGLLVSGSPYQADTLAETDRYHPNTTYSPPNLPVNSNPTSMSQVIIDDKLYKGIVWDDSWFFGF